jgi:hypothetical protein
VSAALAEAVRRTKHLVDAEKGRELYNPDPRTAHYFIFPPERE